jgi:hypothetical protein
MEQHKKEVFTEFTDTLMLDTYRPMYIGMLLDIQIGITPKMFDTILSKIV